MFNCCGTLEVSFALRAFLLRLEPIDLGLRLFELLVDVLFTLPLCFNRFDRLIEICKLLVDFFESLFALCIFFFLQCRLFHDEVHLLAFQLIELGGLTLHLELEPARGFVDQVDRLIGEEAIGDVTRAQCHRREECFVADAYPVMDFVLLFDPTEDAERVLGCRLKDGYRLESSFERGVFLDVLTVLFDRRRSDGVELPTCERGLEEITCIGRSFC